MRFVRGAFARLSTVVAWTTVTACAGVLQLNEYSDAAGTLCECAGPQGDAKCQETISTSLDKATPEEREQWLAIFVEDQCNSTCSAAVDCYNRAPVCTNKTAGCECCVYDEETPTCKGSECVMCKTCSEVIELSLPDIIPDRMNVCADSKRSLDDLADCVCATCGGQCGALCNTGGTNIGCSACVMTVDCGAELDACQNDVRPN